MGQPVFQSVFMVATAVKEMYKCCGTVSEITVAVLSYEVLFYVTTLSFVTVLNMLLLYIVICTKKAVV